MFRFSIGLLFISASMAQTVFDAASIRPHALGRGGEGSKRESIQANPGSLNMRNVSLKTAIRWAYHVMEYQISGPDWLGSERFDIVAKATGPAPEAELRTMLQALLVERFKLKLHKETKDLPAYVLLIAKGGIKFKESKEEGEMAMGPPPDKNHMTVTMKRVPASMFVEELSNALRAPVINNTGLEGRYDATIDVGKYMMDIPQKDAAFDPVPMIVTGLQEELGLKLESKKMPLDLLIIDHAEKVPVEN
jgi:uncharacterized protein (TIGR03435 family)